MDKRFNEEEFRSYVKGALALGSVDQTLVDDGMKEHDGPEEASGLSELRVVMPDGVTITYRETYVLGIDGHFFAGCDELDHPFDVSGCTVIGEDGGEMEWADVFNEIIRGDIINLYSNAIDYSEITQSAND